MTILDADGHVTETQDQIVKYLDEPYRRRPSGAFFYPWDGWDRRLLGTLGDWAGDAETWLRALDKGGVDQTVLYPTLGLFVSFLRDRQWAVALCRAYNTFLHEHFVQLTSMIFEGVPEKFPRLRVAFLEAGCGWAPYWMERMDDEYAKRRSEAPALKKRPSEYVRSGTIYFSCEADEWLLPQALERVGENQIVYASDFPHWDNSYPGSLDEIKNRGDIGEAQKQKILGGNARRLYGL